MPNRIIKDGIRTSKSVNNMTDFQFRMWVYLITYVDDFGRGSADPELLKGLLLPRRKGVTESTIAKTLADLASNGSVILYEVDGEPYLCFPNWGEHQRIQTKKSKFPAPNEQNLRKSTVAHGDSPPNPIQSNPIQSKPIQSKKTVERDAAFDEFWSAYPKKAGKNAARKAFAKVEVPVNDLVAAIEQQKQTDQWRKDNGQYIPHPATWLNQGRWEDQVTTAPNTNAFTPKKRFVTTGTDEFGLPTGYWEDEA